MQLVIILFKFTLSLEKIISKMPIPCMKNQPQASYGNHREVRNQAMQVSINPWYPLWFTLFARSVSSDPVNEFITRNDRSFHCPSIYTDTIQDAILFIDSLTMLDTTKLII